MPYGAIACRRGAYGTGTFPFPDRDIVHIASYARAHTGSAGHASCISGSFSRRCRRFLEFAIKGSEKRDRSSSPEDDKKRSRYFVRWVMVVAIYLSLSITNRYRTRGIFPCFSPRWAQMYPKPTKPMRGRSPQLQGLPPHLLQSGAKTPIAKMTDPPPAVNVLIIITQNRKDGVRGKTRCALPNNREHVVTSPNRRPTTSMSGTSSADPARQSASSCRCPRLQISPHCG